MRYQRLHLSRASMGSQPSVCLAVTAGYFAVQDTDGSLRTEMLELSLHHYTFPWRIWVAKEWSWRSGRTAFSSFHEPQRKEGGKLAGVEDSTAHGMVELVQRRRERFHPTFLPSRPPGSSNPLKCTLVRVCWDKKQTQDRCWSGEALRWRCRACVLWIFNTVTHSHGEQCRQIEWFGPLRFLTLPWSCSITTRTRLRGRTRGDCCLLSFHTGLTPPRQRANQTKNIHSILHPYGELYWVIN